MKIGAAGVTTGLAATGLGATAMYRNNMQIAKLKGAIQERERYNNGVNKN
jgi:hypothetical protein